MIKNTNCSVLYITDNDRCPSPVDDSDVVTMPCDDTDQDGVCRLECLDPGRYISARTPHYRSCSALGVFFWQYPYQKLVLPTCAGKFSRLLACLVISNASSQINLFRNILSRISSECQMVCIHIKPDICWA